MGDASELADRIARVSKRFGEVWLTPAECESIVPMLREIESSRATVAALQAERDEAVGIIEELLEPDTGQPDGMDLGGHLIYRNPVPKAERFLARLAAAPSTPPSDDDQP